MFESLTSPLPVIAIPDTPSFFPAIQKYIANLEDIPIGSPSLADSVALLAQATPDWTPLCEQASNILSDLFPTFRKLSEATHAREGQNLIEDYLGESTAKRVIRFWQEDISRE
jgi:hypothetical protein